MSKWKKVPQPKMSPPSKQSSGNQTPQKPVNLTQKSMLSALQPNMNGTPLIPGADKKQ